MEHLFGMGGFSTETRERISELLARRADERGLSNTESVSAGSFVFVHLSDSATPPCARLHHDAGRALAWVGHVVGQGLDLWPSAPDLLRRLGEDYPNFLSGLDGHYAMGLYEEGSRCLSLAGDPLGIWPLYYLRAENGLLFSTSPDLLIYASPIRLAFHPQAVAEYLHMQYSLGEKTFAREITRLAPGELLQFYCHDSSVSRETYYAPFTKEQQEEPAVEQLVLALEEAVRRRLRHLRPLVCFLTGGFDSRALSGTLARLHTRFCTITTYCDTGVLDDIDAARLVAETLGVENTYIPQPPDYLERYWRLKCSMTDFATSMHTWIVHVSVAHRATGSVNYDGIGGDTAIKCLLVRPDDIALFEAGRHDEVIWALSEAHRAGNLLSEALLPDLATRWQKCVHDSITAHMTPYLNHPNGLSLFYLRNATRRAIGASSCGLLATRLDNVGPFLDRDVLNLALAIPPSKKVHGRLYRRLLAAIDARFADMPSTNDWEWPEEFPRRRRPRICTKPAGGLLSHLDEVEKGWHLIPHAFDPSWLADARAAVMSGPPASERLVNDVQSMGELFLWLNTYQDKVDVLAD